MIDPNEKPARHRLPEIEQAILAKAKDEIVDHVLSGRIPVGIRSLAGAHEHVDTYHLGFNGDYSRESLRARFFTDEKGNPRDGDQYLDLVTRVGAQLDGWIQNGRMFQEAAEASASPERMRRTLNRLLNTIANEDDLFPSSLRLVENPEPGGPPCFIGFERGDRVITDPLHGVSGYVSLKPEEIESQYGIDESMARTIVQANTFLSNSAVLMQMRDENPSKLVFTAGKIAKAMGSEECLNMTVAFVVPCEATEDEKQNPLELAKRLAAQFADEYMRKPAEMNRSDAYSIKDVSAWKQSVSSKAFVDVSEFFPEYRTFARDASGDWVDRTDDMPVKTLPYVEWANYYQVLTPDDAVDIALDEMAHVESNLATVAVVHLEEMKAFLDLERYLRDPNPQNIEVIKVDHLKSEDEGLQALPNEEAERLRTEGLNDGRGATEGNAQD